MSINRGRTTTTEGAHASLARVLSFLLFVSWWRALKRRSNHLETVWIPQEARHLNSFKNCFKETCKYIFSYILDDRIICYWWLGILNVQFNVFPLHLMFRSKFWKVIDLRSHHFFPSHRTIPLVCWPRPLRVDSLKKFDSQGEEETEIGAEIWFDSSILKKRNKPNSVVEWKMGNSWKMKQIPVTSLSPPQQPALPLLLLVIPLSPSLWPRSPLSLSPSPFPSHELTRPISSTAFYVPPACQFHSFAQPNFAHWWTRLHVFSVVVVYQFHAIKLIIL